MFVFKNPTQDPNILTKLLVNYHQVMVLNIFVDGDDDLKQKYIETIDAHNTKILTQITDSPHDCFIDAGFDLFAPGNEGEDLNKYVDNLHFFGPNASPYTSPVNKLDFKVSCSAQMYTDTGKTYHTGYYMYPRSSLSKTQLRLANATGIIDAGYRGHLIGMFDVINTDNISVDYVGKKYDRYIQICSPNLSPILVNLVHSKEELGIKTERGDGGFGSTGR
jgi:dUTPase